MQVIVSAVGAVRCNVQNIHHMSIVCGVSCSYVYCISRPKHLRSQHRGPNTACFGGLLPARYGPAFLWLRNQSALDKASLKPLNPSLPRAGGHTMEHYELLERPIKVTHFCYTGPGAGSSTNNSHARWAEVTESYFDLLWAARIASLHEMRTLASAGSEGPATDNSHARCMASCSGGWVRLTTPGRSILRKLVRCCRNAYTSRKFIPWALKCQSVIGRRCGRCRACTFVPGSVCVTCNQALVQ